MPLTNSTGSSLLDFLGNYKKPPPPTPSAYESTPTDQQNPNMQLDIAALGGTNPQQYGGTFNQAYQGLGQPGTGHEQVIQSGTQELADAFIDRFHEKNGSLPSAQQVKDFVSGNLDSGYASNYIKGTMNRDQIKSQMVDPYLNSNNLTGGADATGVEGRMKTLADKVDEYYKNARSYLTEGINEPYYQQKANVANDLAGAGLLSSGVSRYALNDLEANKNRSISQGLATLASNQATGQTDISKTIENILAGQRGLQQGANQFQQNLNFSKNQYQNQLDYQNRSLDLASQLGRLQANAGGGWGSGAAGGAISGAALGANFGWPGALAGGAGGALVGALGTKK